jgi:integrase
MSVKRGNVAVKIYRHKSRLGYVSFVVAYYQADGHLERATFAEFAAAKARAEGLAERLSTGEELILALEGPDRLRYLRATEMLQPVGIPIDVAVSEYAQAIQLLGGKGTLLEAVRCFSKQHGDPIRPRRVQDVVDELIATREKDGSSVRHVKDLRSRLDRFAASFECEIGTVTAGDIQDFLLALKLAPKTVNNFRCAVSNLFGFARLKRYFAKDSNPLEEVSEVKEPERDVGIYTPGEVQLLIQRAPPRFLAYVLIAAFAGLRQSEIERLEWHHIGADYIRVPGGERRTKSKRLVRLQPNLQKWLAAIRLPAGRVVPYSNVSNEIVDLCKKAGVKSQHNGLRHSYGSYRIAILQDPAKVAHEMGNSTRIVAKHYQELVTLEQAQAWFAITPEQPANLIAFKSQQADVEPPAGRSDAQPAETMPNGGAV